MPYTELTAAEPALAEARQPLAAEVMAVARLDSVPTLLDVVCTITGMGFAAVARVTADSWTACAVRDEINFGVRPGDQLALETTLCVDSMRNRAPIALDCASQDFHYRTHPSPRIYGIESYISVPIVLADGHYFGNLCAIDRAPAQVRNPQIIGMFTSFAALIATQLGSELVRDREHAELSDARATSELREQFIAVLGHDLRNPLLAISATSELIAMKSADPVLASMALRIKASVRRMSSLIDDVLDFARGRLGSGLGVQLNTTEDIDTALEAVVKELQDGQPEREIIASIDVSQAVRCDLRRVQQVASNLIANALTHGALASPVRVSARADEQAMILEVWNEGEPIAPSNLQKVFEPYWRGGTARHRQGLGLGLYICSEIVRAHGGGMSVTSTRKGGTRFAASFPLHTP